MAKRTNAQIESDYKRIKKAAEDVKSFKELEKVTGLSYAEIMVSLQKHPRVYTRIKTQMELSRKEGPHNAPASSDEKKEKEQYIVIDASITICPNIENVLKAESTRIIITSVTVRELARMQHFESVEAMRARHILLMAAESEDKFVHKLIAESSPTPDDNILEFCRKNKACVTLYTSDKEMYNLARAYSIPAKLFRKNPERRQNGKLTTLQHSHCVGSKLIFDLDVMNKSYRTAKVISNGVEYTAGIVELAIGDDIFVASKKQEGHVAFAHYQVVSLTSENNCNMVFSRRLYDLGKLEVSHRYKSFLRDFKRKVS